MAWVEGTNLNNIVDRTVGVGGVICRSPDRTNNPSSYANWGRTRYIIMQAPAMLAMLKRVVEAADGGPVIEASEIESLINRAELGINQPRSNSSIMTGINDEIPQAVRASQIEPYIDEIPLTGVVSTTQPYQRAFLETFNSSRFIRRDVPVRTEMRQFHPVNGWRFTHQGIQAFPNLPDGGEITAQQFLDVHSTLVMDSLDIDMSGFQYANLHFTLRDGRSFNLRNVMPEIVEIAQRIARLSQPVNTF